MDWSKGISGDWLRVMMERAGSGCTVVASGGKGSSRLPQPSSVATSRVDSNRPAGLATAPRPGRTVGLTADLTADLAVDLATGPVNPDDCPEEGFPAGDFAVATMPWFQWVDATHWASTWAGVEKPTVFLGRILLYVYTVCKPRCEFTGPAQHFG